MTKKLISIIFLMVFIFPSSATAKPTSNRVTNLPPIMDSYVSGYNADSNYGGQTSLYIGELTDNPYAMIMRFENIPVDLDYLTLCLDFYGLYETHDLYGQVITGANMTNWDEYSITYLNWPYDYDTIITTESKWQITTDGVISFDLDRSIGNSTFDIIFTTPVTDNSYFYCVSKENTYSWMENPILIAEKEEIQTTTSSPTPTTPPTTTSSSTTPSEPEPEVESIPGYSIGFGLLGVICSVFIIMKFKKHNK